jgi:hypothetical protein
MHLESDREPGARIGGPFTATINGNSIRFSDPVPSARQILNATDFVPADECILIQVLTHGTRSVGLDETVDLRLPGVEVFWAFKADRIYRFTVDERGFEWGAAAIKESRLRTIAHVKDDDVLVLEQKNHPDHELGPDDEVRLAEPGTEHLRVEKRMVEVFFKDVPYLIPRGVYTTEELMAKFPIEPGYLLNLKTPEDELVTLKPGQKTAVKAGMHFYSQVPGGGSS